MAETAVSINSPAELGLAVQTLRRRLGLRQRDLALAAGVGERFIVDLEVGKPRVQLDRVLQVLQALGVRITIQPPVGAALQGTAIARPSATATLTTAAKSEKEGGGG